MATTQMNIRLNQVEYELLEELSARTGRTKTFYAEEFIRTGLEDLADYYLAKDALAEFIDSDDAGVAHEDVDWDSLGQ